MAKKSNRPRNPKKPPLASGDAGAPAETGPTPDPEKAPKTQQPLFPMAADLSVVSLEEEMKRSYLDYAMSVIIGRAIPDIKDGLKPVHRRCLYSMYETGTAYNKPYKKSARIVGDVIGKYHPHGDQAAYDTIVRMAQEFSMRAVLVDGQGNFGSIDGDPPAAMRYTEVRMSKLASEMLADIEKDTVNFIPNYDESLTMPEVLPARFPNLLVNGSSGIAVGMATNIPPHNLAEVCDAVSYLIEHPNASLDKIMEIIPGPDFPTGGYIFNQQGLRDAYRDGRGSIQIRAKSIIERGDKGERERIVINEIPYAVNKSRLLESIAELVNQKKIEGIADIRDESDREGIRIVLEIKRGELPEVVLNNLYKHTALQTSFGIIMLAIVDKQPKVLSLIDIMKYFIAHRQDVIRRRTRHDLKKAEARAHILEGLTIALDHLDAIIKLIRASKNAEEARAGLMEKFKLSQLQAQAILEMQLQRLTNLEREKIVQEYQEVKALIAKLRKILSSDKMVMDIIGEELREVKAAFSDPRRTELRGEIVADLRPEDLIKEEDVVVLFTQSGYVKRTSLSSYHFQIRGGKGRKGISMKAEDVVESLFVCSTHSYLMFFTNIGRVYWLKALEIPDVGIAGRGKAIANLIEFQPDEKCTSVVAVKDFVEDKFIVMMTTDGQIKKTALNEFQNIRKGGIIAIGLRPKAQLMWTRLTDGKRDVVIATKMGKAIRFGEKDIRSMGRTAAGVRGMTLAKKDEVIGMVAIGEEDKFIFTASEKGYGKKTEIDLYRKTRRGGKGILNLKVTPKIGSALGILGVGEDDLLVVTFSGKVIRIKTTAVRASGRATQGVRLINLDEQDRVCSVAKAGESE
ncbi:MAG: DNA gyrase subunit A [Candidatus Aminicenantes bacterium]|nr:DNA gyrase subunit A [Candidatus Aminicenantes bacterium]